MKHETCLLNEHKLLNMNEDILYNHASSIVHKHIMVLNVAALKNKVNNNSLLMETLIAIVVSAYRQYYDNLVYSYDSGSTVMFIDGESTDHEKMKNFKDDMLERIFFAYSDIYLDKNNYEQLTTHFNGKRISYESVIERQQQFIQFFEINKFKTQLEKELPIQQKNIKPTKI